MSAEQDGDVRLVEARHGKFFVLATDLYVGRSLSTYGEWTEEEVALIGQALRPGDCVADVGANIGSHTVPFAKAVGPGGRVMAFEPQPRVFQLLAAPYWHVVPFFDARNFRAVPQDVFSNMGCVNNLCIPQEVSVELRGLKRVASTAEHPRL